MLMSELDVLFDGAMHLFREHGDLLLTRPAKSATEGVVGRGGIGIAPIRTGHQHAPRRVHGACRTDLCHDVV